MRKTLSFQEKYENKVETKAVSIYKIKNEKNDLEIIIDDVNVIIASSKKVDLNDSELNEFLCSYKKVKDNNTLKIKVFENVNDEYDY